MRCASDGPLTIYDTHVTLQVGLPGRKKGKICLNKIKTPTSAATGVVRESERGSERERESLAEGDAGLWIIQTLL